MRHSAASGGFTIVEVLIVLAVSAVIFFFAIQAVGGQQAHVEFTAAVNNVNSKFQQWINDVSNGFTASSATSLPANLVCDTNNPKVPGHPELINAGSGNERGANPQCIFLGKAIQVNTVNAAGGQNSQLIYAYSILGRRVDQASGELVDNLTDAFPTPAMFSLAGGQGDLTETYTIPNGARVLWAKSGTDLSGNSQLAGFYTSFNSGNGGNGSQSLNTYQYNFTGNAPGDVPDGSIAQCIEMVTPSCQNPTPLQQWVICLESTRNSDTSAIYINSTNGQGATTKVVSPCPGS